MEDDLDIICVLVTDHGITANPGRPDVEERLRAAGLTLTTVPELYERAVSITGVPRPIEVGGEVVGVTLLVPGAVKTSPDLVRARDEAVAAVRAGVEGERWRVLDVHDGDHPLSRTSLGPPPRRCLVGDGPAHACARSRAHDASDLARAVEVLRAAHR
ncbi:citrate lyase holo-[acyl-carrier protein] synthase [Arsenicicoccus cauae]|uniref:citrate lyase holo-[acyl-carrier protein] synthase n=1 Tax=Arsenicicoccus cauae TaxID=2663847 RepID=UPI00370DA90A